MSTNACAQTQQHPHDLKIEDLLTQPEERLEALPVCMHLACLL